MNKDEERADLLTCKSLMLRYI